MNAAVAWATRIRKLLAAVVGLVLQALNLGVLPDDVHSPVAIAIAVLTALGVYTVPNGADPDVDDLTMRVATVERSQLSASQVQQAFAAGTAEAVKAVATPAVPDGSVIAPLEAVDPHHNQSGPAGQWPTLNPDDLPAAVPVE